MTSLKAAHLHASLEPAKSRLAIIFNNGNARKIVLFNIFCALPLLYWVLAIPDGF